VEQDIACISKALLCFIIMLLTCKTSALLYGIS